MTANPAGTSTSAQSLWAADRDHVLHPFQHFESFARDGALLIDRGEGCYLFDTGGKRYFDAVGGLWCNSVGLGRDEMADTIAGQVRRLAYSSGFVDMSNPRAAELGVRLAALAPGDLNRVLFTTGGSTAVDSAVRLIQLYHYSKGTPLRRHMIVRRQSYHGSTYIASSLSGKDRMAEFSYQTDWIHFVSCPNYYRAPEGMNEGEFCDVLVRELEQKIQSLGPDTVAAFFAEPIMGAGGVIVPPRGYNERTYALCRQYGVLYVADEVVTGFGRLGHWFASKGVFGIEPDIITCAKGLTSGYLPLGACLYSDRIHEAVSHGDCGRFFGHGYTYSGHPVSCAAALKTLEIVEREKLMENVRNVGSHFERRLAELVDLPIVGDVRGQKLMMCVEFVTDRRSKELFPEELNIGKRVSNRCEEMGLIVRSLGHLNVMSPAFIMTHAQVDFVVDTLRRGIEETMAGLRADRVWDG